ncbi:hypothetical protein G5I_01383 [Acromyrmex echinatior]|uniref:Uncharacterized protein n=1 Tax=Acromyrmex echinatior TaxID=103372 RepID=F4W7G7_ACREC|nr:hypothetical protein G5I_01383 [Acromyrmex echinatior]
MFYNNVPTKTAVSKEGGRKYSPAATKKFIFFQLRDERRSEGRFSLRREGLSTPLTLSESKTLAFSGTTSDRPGDSGHQEVSPSVGICTGSLAEAGLGVVFGLDLLLIFFTTVVSHYNVLGTKLDTKYETCTCVGILVSPLKDSLNYNLIYNRNVLRRCANLRKSILRHSLPTSRLIASFGKTLKCSFMTITIHKTHYDMTRYPDFIYWFPRNMIVKSVPNSDFNRECHTTRGRRANSIVNCFIAIVGSKTLTCIVDYEQYIVLKKDNKYILFQMKRTNRTNQTRTTFFFKSSFSAIAAIFSPDGRGCTAKYASNERFSGAAMLVRFRFFSPAGNTEGASGSRRLFFAWASASSSHAWRIGFRAIMLLCESVSDSKRQIVDCERAPTPGSFRLASALPTSACVTPSLMRRCLNRSAKASNSRGSVSASGCRPAAAAAAAAAAIAG